MTLPNFLLIGAAKSGTTALHAYLQQHPDIFLASPKELRFFSYTGPYPEDLEEKYIHRGVTTLEEYQRHFEDPGSARIIGEASPMYLYTPGTAERIKNLIPDVKLLAILRNPVDRAFSAFTHALRDWTETEASFEEALKKEPERIRAGWGILWHYTQAGFYAQQLRRYYDIFNKDQIKVVLYDDLAADAMSLCQAVFEYLGVDASFEPDLSKRPNVSGFPKNSVFHQFMERLFMKDNAIKRISQQLFPKAFRRRVMESLRRINMEKRAMPESIRQDLISLFREDIQQLERLINRDLSHWMDEKHFQGGNKQ